MAHQLLAGEGRFAGQIKDLGPVPRALITELRNRTVSLGEVWPQAGARFSQVTEGLDNLALMFPTDYPASHLNSTPTEHWGRWHDYVIPLLDLVADRLGLASYRPAKVILSRLRAGASIPDHVDLNPSSQVPHKVHVPVITSPQVTFEVEDDEYHLESGRAYEINNLLRHAAYNRGTVDRLHLIVEVYAVAPLGQHLP